MQRAENILLALVAALMDGNQLDIGQDLDVKGIGLERQLGLRLFGRHGITIGFKEYLAIRVEPHFATDATGKRLRRQRTQVHLLHLPALAMVCFWRATRRCSSSIQVVNRAAFSSANESTSASGAMKNQDWDDGYATTAPVGSYPSGKSWVGAADMAGNVAE